MKIIRCIHSKDFTNIKSGKYEDTKVAVYYGYTTYRCDMEYMNWIAEAVKFEHPEIQRRDMAVYHFTKYHSGHFNQMFIRIILPVEQIKTQMDRYSKL